MTLTQVTISDGLSPPDVAFTTRLPKIELHAHLTGSISRSTLHEIWASKKDDETTTGASHLEDPLLALPLPGSTDGKINVATFFPLFDKYIYQLVNILSAVHMSTLAVLQEFADDGVVYLELRTTPRNVAGEGKDSYVRTVLQAMNHFMETQDRMHVQLILSLDRRNTLEEALEVVDLAKKYRAVSAEFPLSQVVGLDLCGNPARTPITHLAPALHSLATLTPPLPLTVHFAEIPTSSTKAELDFLLSLNPRRLGHVIHVLPSSPLATEIAARGLGLELCLSCNVQAGMLPPLTTTTTTKASSNDVPEELPTYKNHHFAYWHGNTKCPIILGTDDVGVFGSPLSEEYRLVGEHFDLSRQELVELSRGAVGSIFGSIKEKERLKRLIGEFERDEFSDI